MTLILVIRRFWNGLLKEEVVICAFTLPVEVWQLIVSKVIVASIVNLISVLIAALSWPDPVSWHLQGDLLQYGIYVQCNMEINDRRACAYTGCSDRAWESCS